jgi:hypothetical protein
MGACVSTSHVALRGRLLGCVHGHNVVMRKSQRHIRHRHHPAHCVVTIRTRHCASVAGTDLQSGVRSHPCQTSRVVRMHTLPRVRARYLRVSVVKSAHAAHTHAIFHLCHPHCPHPSCLSRCGVLAWDSSAVLSFPAPTPTRLCYVETGACVASRLIPVADCVASRSLSA